MSYQKSGIPLPTNPDVTGLRCIALYIPDDDIYLQALGGQITELAKWTSWEKRGDNSAAIAAMRWKDANDKTWDELWTKGLIMTCENVQDLIDILSSLNQTMIDNTTRMVNAINNLELTNAPFDCLPCEDRVYTQPEPSPNPDPNNPPVGQNPEEWYEYLCRATNYLWYEHVSRGGAELILLTSVGQGIVGVGAVAAVMYATGIGAPIAFLLTIAAGALAVLSLMDSTEFELQLDNVADDVICAIYTSDGAEDALQNMVDVMEARGVAQEVIDYVVSMTGYNAFNKLFNGEIVVPAEFNAPVDCDYCASPVPTPPTGYGLIEALESEVSYPTNQANADMTYDQATGVFTYEVTGNPFNHRVSVDVDESALLSRVSASSMLGAVAVLIGDNTVNARFFNFATTNSAVTIDPTVMSAGENHIAFPNAEYGAVPAFADWVGEFDYSSGFTPATADASFYADNGDTIGTTLAVRVLWVVKY